MSRVCRVCALAIAACESSHLTVFGWMVVCRALCTGEMTTARVGSVPEALTLKATPRVWNVCSDGAPDEACVDMVRKCGAVEGQDDVRVGSCLLSLSIVMRLTAVTP